MRKKLKETDKLGNEGLQKYQKFEACIKRLEDIVGLLEEGTVSLEESIKLYEEGIELARVCMARLNEAELKMKKLNKSLDGKINIEDFRLDE